jgi:hypothetical protein
MHNLTGLVEQEKRRIISILAGIHAANGGKLTPKQVEEVAALTAKAIREAGTLRPDADDGLDEHELARKLSGQLIAEGHLAGLKFQIEHESMS